MNIEQTIKKAIKGGWNMGLVGDDFSLSFTKVMEGKANYTIKKDDGYTFYEDVPVSRIFLDPKFWQALGKAMGWGEDTTDESGRYKWHWKWVEFIDHLAEGKDAESYFKQL